MYDFSVIPNFGDYNNMMGQNMFGNNMFTPNVNVASGVGGGSGFGSDFFNPRPDSLGFNGATIGMGLQGLSTLGNLWGAFQSNKLARQQFNFTKDFANTNLNNQIQSYNTALEDRARSRAVQEGQSSEQAQAYIDKNRLSR